MNVYLCGSTACGWKWKLLMQKLPYRVTEFFRKNMREEVSFLTALFLFTVFCALGHQRLQGAKNGSMTPGSFSPLRRITQISLKHLVTNTRLCPGLQFPPPFALFRALTNFHTFSTSDVLNSKHLQWCFPWSLHFLFPARERETNNDLKQATFELPAPSVLSLTVTAGHSSHPQSGSWKTKGCGQDTASSLTEQTAGRGNNHWLDSSGESRGLDPNSCIKHS